MEQSWGLSRLWNCKHVKHMGYKFLVAVPSVDEIIAVVLTFDLKYSMAGLEVATPKTDHRLRVCI